MGGIQNTTRGTAMISRSLVYSAGGKCDNTKTNARISGLKSWVNMWKPVISDTATAPANIKTKESSASRVQPELRATSKIKRKDSIADRRVIPLVTQWPRSAYRKP